MISNNATRCRAYGLRTQVFQVLKSFPTKLIGQLWTVLVNLEQLSRNLDIKIIKKILPPNINLIFNIIFLICSYSVKKFLCCAFLLCSKVLKMPKSSYCARSYRAKKFLLRAFLLRTPSNLLDWKILANQGASGSYCACSYCAHPL